MKEHKTRIGEEKEISLEKARSKKKDRFYWRQDGNGNKKVEDSRSRRLEAGLGARKCCLRRESTHCTRRAGQVDLRQDHHEGYLFMQGLRTA